jgi:EAL domain-containing protein (putative c-di-GMP-specific phosphodiesterase class I)
VVEWLSGLPAALPEIGRALYQFGDPQSLGRGWVGGAIMLLWFGPMTALPLDIALAINLSAGTIARHADPLAHLLRRSARLVIVEITEEDDRDDLRSIALLRSAGIAIALDDAGAGRTGPHRIRRISPDIVKLDGALLHAARSNRGAYDMLRAITAVSREIGAELVAEGLETAADVAQAISFGASMGQGYVFGAPAPAEQYRRLRRVSA